LTAAGDNTSGPAGIFDLPLEVFDAHFGNIFDGFLGHQINNPPEAAITDLIDFESTSGFTGNA